MHPRQCQSNPIVDERMGRSIRLHLEKIIVKLHVYSIAPTCIYIQYYPYSYPMRIQRTCKARS